MKNIVIVILLGLVVAFACLLYEHGGFRAKQSPETALVAGDIYYCPMHPQVTSSKPGECPQCHMSLVKRSVEPPVAGAPKGEKKVLYYRNPMNPDVTSPVPMRDEMGMDYVPVYEEPAAGASKGFYISPEKQQLIGVKTGKVEKREMAGTITTVGRVAYDPDLYVAQEEYLQSIKGGAAAAVFPDAAKRKLLLMGMSEKEIGELTKQGSPEEGLYLPDKNSKVWVYLTIYEYEAAVIKEGQAVEVTTAAYPQDVFKGKVVAVAPMVESTTRSLRARAKVDNPQNKLKLEMYVDAAITYNLGKKLTVPQEAVLNAGLRTYVFSVDAEGYFQAHDVKLGAKAGDYYEVLSGLSEGDSIVTSGNFLVDSESKLNSVLSQMSEQSKVPQAGAK
jgi:membrane fusion protein, copper/silver efflux system